MAGRELAYTQGYGAANRDYLSGLAGHLRDLDYDLAALDESYQNAVADWDAQREEDYALSDTLQWSDEQDAENLWSQAAGVAQADLWRAEYASQTGAATELDNQLNSPWSDVQRDLAAAKQTWWDSNEPAYLAWIGQTSAADTAYQGHVNAAYLGRTGGWTAADVDYTHDVAAAARQWVEDRADEQHDYLMDQASRSYTYVDQYAQSRHDARVAWAAADRWSRLGEDDSGADYDSERHGQDVQAAHDAFAAASNTSRREYRRHRATGEAHRDIRLAEIDLQYVEDVAGSYVDWTAEVELHRRAFTETEATEASGRTYSIAADDDSYWRQEAGTFAADLAANYPPSSSGPIGAPWGPYAAAQESAEAGWVTTTSTSRRVWEDSVADARKTERFDVAAALETRNNRLAQAWAEREITKAAGRLQTARTGAYDDVIATLAGTRQQPLPRLPDCSPSATGEPSAAFYQAAECLPAFSPLNLPAVLPDDYQIPVWVLPPTTWGTDYTYGLTALTWVPPAQLADTQVHPATPPVPGTFLFPASLPSPLDLSASLSSTAFPQYYNNVIDLIFGKWNFDATRHLRGFRAVGTAVDSVFRAYASPPSEATEHLVSASANSDGTSGTTSGDLSPDAGYPDSSSSGSSSPGGTYGAAAESSGLLGSEGYSPNDDGGAGGPDSFAEPTSADSAGGSFGEGTSRSRSGAAQPTVRPQAGGTAPTTPAGTSASPVRPRDSFTPQVHYDYPPFLGDAGVVIAVFWLQTGRARPFDPPPVVYLGNDGLFRIGTVEWEWQREHWWGGRSIRAPKPDALIRLFEKFGGFEITQKQLRAIVDRIQREGAQVPKGEWENYLRAVLATMKDGNAAASVVKFLLEHPNARYGRAADTLDSYAIAPGTPLPRIKPIGPNALLYRDLPSSAMAGTANALKNIAELPDLVGGIAASPTGIDVTELEEAETNGTPPLRRFRGGRVNPAWDIGADRRDAVVRKYDALSDASDKVVDSLTSELNRVRRVRFRAEQMDGLVFFWFEVDIGDDRWAPLRYGGGSDLNSNTRFLGGADVLRYWLDLRLSFEATSSYQ